MTVTPPNTPPDPINPFYALLRSRKFLLACGGILLTVLGYYANLPENLLIAIDSLIGVVIAGIAYEDGSEGVSGKPPQ